MATTTFTAAPRNGSDAEFRAWGSGLSTALAAVGLVKTSDTGQINWTTVTAPAGVTTYQGYEIWRLNDSLQATAPFYFKIEYGSGTPSASNIGTRWTIGKGSDGAGAITGVILSATTLSSASNSATPSTWYVSGGDGSMFGIVAATGFFNTAALTYNFVFDRSRAADQSATGVGAHFTSQVVASQNTRVFNHASGSAYIPYRWPAVIPAPNAATTLAAGGKAPLFPAVLTDGLGNYWQPRAALVGITADMGNFVPMTVTGFGTYMGMGGGTMNYDGFQLTNSALALLWE